MSELHFGTCCTEIQNQVALLENCWYLEFFLISECTMFYMNVKNPRKGVVHNNSVAINFGMILKA